MKRAALYGAPQAGAEWQKCYSALSAALTNRFGVGRLHQRSTKSYSDEDVDGNVAVAVVLGLRAYGEHYRNRCLELGIPTLVVDLGWLRRERNYWQLCPSSLNRISSTKVSGDRFDVLGLNVFDARPEGRSILIAGQQPGDKQHDLETDRSMVRWGGLAAKEAAAVTGKRIFWRPHPGALLTLPKPAINSSPSRSIYDFINMEGVSGAVVYNSTLGLELLRQGCNVVAQGPRTVYTDLVHCDISHLRDGKHPGPDAVRELLNRVAYGQYTTHELNNWSNLEKVLELNQITGDW